jgi:hypothetical membrane protein
MPTFTHSLLRALGFAGPGVIAVAILWSALVYRGKRNERFSLLNHFISELGELGVSAAAQVFNTGLILGGLLLFPYILWLGFVFHGLSGWLGSAAGVVATLSVSAVGIFPMNDLSSHGKAAMTYFRAGLVMVGFFGMAILLQHSGTIVVPQAANLLSLLTVACYASFLGWLSRTSSKEKPTDQLDPEQTPERPRVLTLAILEWAVFFSTILWLFGVAILVHG